MAALWMASGAKQPNIGTAQRIPAGGDARCLTFKSLRNFSVGAVCGNSLTKWTQIPLTMHSYNSFGWELPKAFAHINRLKGECMGDWDFLYEMNERGYSAEEIADAAGSGAAPWEWENIRVEWIDSPPIDGLEHETHTDEPSAPFRSREGFPYSASKQTEIFEDLVDCAIRHFENTGRYLQVWGELGEIYAEVKFGLRRHETHRAGSDGTIGGKLVEVKTISPEKASDHVLVKRQGNFEQLLIVRIDQNFEFKGKLVDRNELSGNTGKFLKGRLKGDVSSGE
jgi:hypothetical protein